MSLNGLLLSELWVPFTHHRVWTTGHCSFLSNSHQPFVIVKMMRDFCLKLSLLVFRCVIKELESLGKALYGAKLIAQRFQVRNCSHHKNPVSGSTCLLSMIEDGNPHHFFIATQVKTHGKCSFISFEVMLWYLRIKKRTETSIMRFLNSLWELIL